MVCYDKFVPLVHIDFTQHLFVEVSENITVTPPKPRNCGTPQECNIRVYFLDDPDDIRLAWK
jgi:hypothetical protein